MIMQMLIALLKGFAVMGWLGMNLVLRQVISVSAASCTVLPVGSAE
jgi:hypothetical protein